jgi:hypothetical protein
MRRRPRRSTTTGGSDEREARSLSAPLLRFGLAEEAARLRAESPYLEGDRNARTLVKAGAPCLNDVDPGDVWDGAQRGVQMSERSLVNIRSPGSVGLVLRNLVA